MNDYSFMPLIHNYAMTLANTNVRHYNFSSKLYFSFNISLALIKNDGRLFKYVSYINAKNIFKNTSCKKLLHYFNIVAIDISIVIRIFVT
jgi:hypothetical protein